MQHGHTIYEYRVASVWNKSVLGDNGTSYIELRCLHGQF